jgi:hypothetical protein
MSELTIPLQQYARTAAQLATENPILLDKQLVIERDTGKMKLGNGTTAFNSLPYLLFSGTSSQFVRGDGSLATFPSIPSIAGLVPYTGATANVNLGTNTITANQLIKSGGTASQFLKADGSIDSTVYYPNSNPSGFISKTVVESQSAGLSFLLENTNNDSNAFTNLRIKTQIGVDAILRVSNVPNIGMFCGTLSNHSYRIITNNIDRFLVTENGNIGISTTPDVFSRANDLTMGMSSASGNAAFAINAGGAAGRGAQIDLGTGFERRFNISSNSIESTIATLGSTPLRFETNSSERIRITADGFILINTTTNNGVDRLQVNGSARITGVVTASQISTTKQTLTPTGTTQTIDWNNGSIVDLVLSSATGNVTLTLLNAQNASVPLIEVTNGATPRNLIFPTGTIQANGGGNVYVGTANQKDLIAVLWDGSQFLISVSRNYA